jgi:hypothetical protein
LFIDDALEHIKLLIDLFGDFFLETLLIQDPVLHVVALIEVDGTRLMYFGEQLHMLVRCLFESEGLAPVGSVLEVAIIAQRRVVQA